MSLLSRHWLIVVPIVNWLRHWIRLGKRVTIQGKMNQNVRKLPIIRVNGQCRSARRDAVAREFPLTIILNERKLATLACSPSDLGHLAVGFLLSKGLLKNRRAIRLITVDAPKNTVWVEAEEARPSPPKKVDSGIAISAAEVLSLLDGFGQHSELFQATGGVHGAALCDKEKILVFAEDISRHNAIDKVFGQCLLEGIDTAGHLIITSGRVSSEVVLKVVERNVPLLVSRAAPTDLGVKLAKKLGLTLIGFAREKRLNIYAHEERLKDG